MDRNDIRAIWDFPFNPPYNAQLLRQRFPHRSSGGYYGYVITPLVLRIRMEAEFVTQRAFAQFARCIARAGEARGM